MTDFNKIRLFVEEKKHGAVCPCLLRQHSGKDLTEEQFKAWSAAASEARHDYVEGNIPGEEMPARVRVD